MTWKPALTPTQAKKANTFKVETESCYVEINGNTVYLEVSEATENVLYVNHWQTSKK